MEDTKKEINVFLSYCWKDSPVAEEIYSVLTQVGVDVVMDKHTLEYKDNLQKYMQHIRKADYALLLLSEDYLKSRNCLYEILQLLKDETTLFDRILPVIVNQAKIYSVPDKLAFVQYWENQAKLLEMQINQSNPVNSFEAFHEVNLYQQIANNILGFLNQITTIKHLSFEELKKGAFLPILQQMGFNDLTYVLDLMPITMMKDCNKRELALDAYLEKYPANTYYYTIRGRTAEMERRFDRAKVFFERALELNSSNLEALNQLGLLLQFYSKDNIKARSCYEKAIEVKPEFTICRLNLGVLLSSEFDDWEGARKQYDAILSYEPNCAKAYHNLGNYYRGKGLQDQAEYHYLKAIEYDPELIEPKMNYGNFLKVEKRKLKEGNAYYRQVLSMTTDKEFKRVLRLMIKSDKG